MLLRPGRRWSWSAEGKEIVATLSGDGSLTKFWSRKIWGKKNKTKQTNQDDTSGSHVGLRIWFLLQERKRSWVQIPDRPSGKKVYIKNDLNSVWVIHGSKRSADSSSALSVYMSKYSRGRYGTPHSSWWLSVCEWVSMEALLQLKA